MKIKYCSLFFLVLVLLTGCKQEQQIDIAPARDIYALPNWAKDAVIYEVNIRQFTPEGTFKAFEQHLPRIKNLGADILWLMPIYPISEEKRKGTLGSYYAISDYKKVNPEFGSEQDFRDLVSTAHSLDMHIILDFVPNHTGWDSDWISNNPEWYTQDEEGNVLDPLDPSTGESWGWTDVADLNYDNQDMRQAMIESMKYWITEHDIDGFRQDVAHQVPVDFWADASEVLLSEKIIFHLAESEVPEIRNNKAFHADYGWEFHHIINEVANGHKTAADIKTWQSSNRAKYSRGFHMHFTSNHDENSWAGTVFERMGDAHKALAALTFSFDGMPLIYGGQEEPLRKRLEFFEKDDIGFENYEYAPFYTNLSQIKKENEALWNGEFGGEPNILVANDQLLVFERVKAENQIVGVFNLSGNTTQHEFDDLVSFTDLTSGETLTLRDLDLGPWEYRILRKEK